MTSRREAMFGAGFAALAAGSFLLRPRRAFAELPRAVFNAAIPGRIGPYRFDSTTGLVLPPSDELSTKLYDQVLTRNYLAPDRPPIMALFAYGSTQNLTLRLHRPEQCYPMQGFDMTPPAPVPLVLDGTDVHADTVTASRPDRTEQVLFWSRIGDAFPPNRATESWLIARDNLRGRMPDGMLVRLSLIDTDAAASLATLRGFAHALVAALPPFGRRLMLGQG